MSYCLHNVSLYGKVTPPTMYLAQSHSFYETGQRSVLNSPQIYRIKHITAYMHFSGLILVLGILGHLLLLLEIRISSLDSALNFRHNNPNFCRGKPVQQNCPEFFQKF